MPGKRQIFCFHAFFNFIICHRCKPLVIVGVVSKRPPVCRHFFYLLPFQLAFGVIVHKARNDIGCAFDPVFLQYRIGSA